jgi:hypothetical protein
MASPGSPFMPGKSPPLRRGSLFDMNFPFSYKWRSWTPRIEKRVRGVPGRGGGMVVPVIDLKEKRHEQF